MQKMTIGGQELTLVASPMTPWIYKKAFGTDMISELAEISEAVRAAGADIDMGKLGMFGLIQKAWAMAKTASPGRVPDFDTWLGGLPDDALDFSAIDVTPIMTELQRGFFRSAKGDTAAKKDEADAE